MSHADIDMILRKWAASRPSRLAIHFLKSGRTYTYRTLLDATDSLSGTLRAAGIGTGDIVALVLNDAEKVALYLVALLRMGAIPLPVDPAVTDPAKHELIRFVAPKGIVMMSGAGLADQQPFFKEAGGDAIDGCRVFVDQRPTEGSRTAPSVLLPTSGTTGKPKIVQISVSGIIDNAGAVCRHLAVGSDDVFLSLTSLCYCHGFYNGVLMPLSIGAGTVVMDRFTAFDAAKFWNVIADYKVSVVNIVPTMIEMLLTMKYSRYARPASLRFFICGTAKLQDPKKTMFETRFAVPIHTQFGMTESLINTINAVSDKPGSQGKPVGCAIEIRSLEGVPLRAGETGEIIIKGNAVTKGYYNNPELTSAVIADGWLRSGDLGRCDNDGYLYVVGRIKEIINKGGAKIFPEEIDMVFRRHPRVNESCTIGIPDDVYGEDICTFLTSREGCDLTAREMVAYAKEVLPGTKVPGKVFIIDLIPRGSTGKPQMDELKRLAHSLKEQ